MRQTLTKIFAEQIYGLEGVDEEAIENRLEDFQIAVEEKIRKKLQKMSNREIAEWVFKRKLPKT